MQMSREARAAEREPLTKHVSTGSIGNVPIRHPPRAIEHSGSLGIPRSRIRAAIYVIIFEAETLPGKIFDVLLLVFILSSVTMVLLESVREVRQQYGPFLHNAQWFFSVVFTLEYMARLICVRRPDRYAASFFGLVDLSALIPQYLSLVFPSTNMLSTIRAFRLLRVFRIFKLVAWLSEAGVIYEAMVNSIRKIVVFLVTVMLVVLFMGTIIYILEGEANGFTSIPKGMYWALVTLTTVGYGDLAPKTAMGQLVASLLMIMGYGVIAVPTGIMSVGIANQLSTPKRTGNTICCPNCMLEGHILGSHYCRDCGSLLDVDLEPETPHSNAVTPGGGLQMQVPVRNGNSNSSNHGQDTPGSSGSKHDNSNKA
eukprot:jgi/Mesvir1/6053/Mv00788-RA.2